MVGEPKTQGERKMNKVMIAIMFGIVLISLASAETIIAGNNYTFSIDTTDDLFWDVVGNSSNMVGFEVHQDIYDNYSTITFAINYRMKPDNFTIILFSNETEEVYRRGGTRKVYVENKTIVEVEKIIGNETDEHGCLLMAGYAWCEPKQRCIRDWEEECIMEEAKKPIKERIILGLIIGLLLITILILIKIINKKVKR